MKRRGERAEEKICTEERGTPWRGPMRKQRYSVRPCDVEKLGLRRRYMLSKGKSAVEGDLKKSWSWIETEVGAE